MGGTRPNFVAGITSPWGNKMFGEILINIRKINWMKRMEKWLVLLIPVEDMSGQTQGVSTQKRRSGHLSTCKFW
jgi:hypothetical protein